MSDRDDFTMQIFPTYDRDKGLSNLNIQCPDCYLNGYEGELKQSYPQTPVLFTVKIKCDYENGGITLIKLELIFNSDPNTSLVLDFEKECKAGASVMKMMFYMIVMFSLMALCINHKELKLRYETHVHPKLKLCFRKSQNQLSRKY